MIKAIEFDADNFNEIIIEEFDNYYLVKIISGVDDELSLKYDKGKEGNGLVYAIEMFLENVKINKVFNRLPTIKNIHRKNYVEVSGLDNKMLKICLYDFKFRYFYDMLLNKYINDRYEFLVKNDIKEVKFSCGSNDLRYENKDGCVNLALCTDEKGNVISLERDAIREILYDKFDSYNEEVTIEMVKDANGINEICVIRCGDFKLTFPRTYTFSLIVGIVNDYNNGIEKNKKR